MIRFLFLLLLSSCAKAQVFPAFGTAPDPCSLSSTIGEFIRDNFDSTALSSKWTVTNAASQTLTFNGTELRVQGNNRGKNFEKRIIRTGYTSTGGYSTLRNTVSTAPFRVGSKGATYGAIFVGLVSTPNSSIRTSSYAVLTLKTTDSLQFICSSDLFDVAAQYNANPASLPSVNTSDTYTLSLSVLEYNAVITLTNVTAGTTQTLSTPYDMRGVSPLRPNTFQYTFGTMGDCDIYFQDYHVTSTEVYHPYVAVIGNSITTGYDAGNDSLSYAYVLSGHAPCPVHILAGAGNGTAETILNLPEILAVAPQIALLAIGTNDVDNTAAQANITTIKNALEAQGCTVYILASGNKGDPNGTGLNHNLKAAFPTAFIDTWTTGWNTMTVANKLMVDALHPSGLGHIYLANIIKGLLPSVFPIAYNNLHSIYEKTNICCFPFGSLRQTA